MKGVTVKDLMLMCKEQIALGNGNKEIIIPSDDEGNEYHQVWSGLCDGKELADWVSENQMFNCKSADVREYVVLT